MNKEILKSEIVGLIDEHIVDYLDGKYPNREKLVDKILKITADNKENKVCCACRECDFNEDGNCVQPYPSIDENGCNVFIDKWDEIESRDR